MSNSGSLASSNQDRIQTQKLIGFIGGLVGVGLVGLLDWETGTQVSFSIVYLMPIGFAVWYGGRLAGVVMSGVAAAVWFGLDTQSGVLYSHPVTHFWNALVRLGFFLLTTLLLGRLRMLTSNLEDLVKERTAALTDEVVRCQRAENAVRESEARFRQFAENIKEVFWITDPTVSEMIYVSPAYEEIWGRTCASLYASPRSWMEAIHPDDREHVSQAVLTKLTSGEYDEVFRIVRPGGSFCWIHDRAFPVRDKSGNVYRIVGIAEDITNRKRAEAHITRLAHAVESTAELICITDSQDRFIFVNSAFQKAYGYTEAELLGKTPEILFSPNNPRPLMQEILEQTRLGGWRGEVLDRRKDGTEFPIFLSTSVIADKNGAPLGLMGVAQDITERKRAEEKVRLLADAVQSTQELISITDHENRFTFVNQAFLDAYGYSESEVLGRMPDFLYATVNPPGLCEQVFQQTVSGGWRGEIVNCRKDGTGFPISLSTSPIKTNSGKTIGLMGVARDISERKRAEKQRAAFELLGRRLSGAASPDQAANLIMDIASELFGWDAGYLHLYSRTEDKIVPVLTVDTVEGKRRPVGSDTFTLDPSPLMRTVMKDGAQLIDREENSPPPVPLVAFGQSHRRSASMMYVPIHTRGMVLGILSIQSYIPRAYSEHDLRLLQILADHCGDALLRIETTEALLAAESRYHRIFEEATEGIFQITLEGRYRNANPALAHMLGLQTPEQLISSTDVWKTYVVAEKAAELKRILETQGVVQEFEVERYHKNGTKIWMSVNAHTVRDASGAILYYEGTDQDITARKRAEAVQRESDARLRMMLEQAPATLWTADLDLKFTSATGSELTALKTDNVLGQSLFEFFGTTDDNFPAIVAHRCALRGGRSVLEMTWGGRFWRANIEPLTDASGRVIGCIGAALDITEAKRVEDQLRTSEQQFRQVTEAIREVFWMTNVDKTQMIYISPGYETVWGRSCANLYGNPRAWVDAIHPDDRDRILQAALAKQASGEYDEEYRIVRPDRSERWIRDRAFPVRDASGGICRIAGIAEDITERKQAVEALRQSERKLRLIAENTTDVIFAFDMDRRPVYVNPAVQRLTGYTFAEIQGKKFINWIHPSDQERMLKHWEDLYMGKGYSDVEFRLITKTGETKWCSSTWGPLFDEEGRQIGVQGREQDITARKQAEEELRRLPQRIIEAQEAEHLRVARELHDGVNQILASAKMRLRKVEESVSAVSPASREILRRCSQLLVRALEENRRIAHNLRPTDLDELGLAAACKNLCKEFQSRTKLTVESRVPRDWSPLPPAVELNLFRIVQEAFNNVEKHAHAKSVRLELAIDGDAVLLKIRDNGRGFGLNASSTAKKPRRGIGLTNMRERAALVGGTCEVVSGPKQGTTITVRLPCAQAK